MGPDPFNMPSFGGSQDFSGQLKQQVSQVAPLATQWHGALSGPSVAPVYNTVSTTTPKVSALSIFTHFLGGTASEIGHVGASVAGWLGKQVTHSVANVANFGYNFSTGAIRSFEESHQQDQLTNQQDKLNGLYKAGKISSADYNSQLKELIGQRNKLSGELQLTQQRLQSSKAEGIDTAATLVAIVSGGVGKALDEAGTVGAAEYLSSAGVDNFTAAATDAINKIAANPEVFNALPEAAQKAIQLSTAEVVANATNASAAQIAKATVVNLAFKYPVYYNYLSTTGNSIYTALDQKKYGSAVRQIAFNAALLLSGGPIGKALDVAGSSLGAIKNATFGEGSFIDELSKGIGDGDPGGLVTAINKLPEEDQADVVKQLSAVEATNKAAVGPDPVAAAIRVLKGMESYEGISMTNFSHEEALSNMVNFAKAQRIASDTAQSLGMKNVTVGRVDDRALNEISANLSPAISSDKSTANSVWESLKSQNTTQAWANNENFDRQIKGIINKYSDAQGVDTAIRGIKAAFKVDGFPKGVEDQLSKMGYMPITPVNLEAPFTEGSGKLATKFSGNTDFFTHAVQPLPILDTLGDALTRIGLSPNASTERVYQTFTDNLATNLGELSKDTTLQGDNAEQTTDSLIKTLSNYAHDPTRGKFVSKMPITDLRMMTKADIKTALQDTQLSDLHPGDIQKAIAQSYLQVPMAIRGLGDRAVDLLYKGGPISAVERRYLRIQGAARFTYNPFFQYLRVVPKTEILTSFEGGGWVNSVFSGQAGQIKDTIDALREGGFLEKSGYGSVLGNEAVDAASDNGRSIEEMTGKNLGKKLLPKQEKSIGGLIQAQASKMGIDARTYMQEFPQQTRDTIQAIAGYDRHANFLNSPLLRTLNTAFFPLRFETKVATIMAKSLAKTSLMTQVSVINGMFKAHQWLNSPEGQAWYSKNANAIGLFEYITPIAEISNVVNSLMPGQDHHLGNFGKLGGLPFGWIPALLDAEGITQFNQPGVNASTGSIYSQYIPATSKGQIVIAVQDFLSELFSYPGAEVGLPSKASATRNAALELTGASKSTDLQLSTPLESSLSKQQQNFIQAIQSHNTQSNAPPQVNNPLYYSPNQTQPGTTVPSTAPAMPSNKGASSSSSKTPKLKKGQRIPQLLPGQTELGQL